MAIRTAEQAHSDIGRHFLALAALMDAAHNQFQTECRSIAHVIDARTRASIYRDLIVRKAREYCDGDAGAPNGAHFYRKGQLCLVGLENKYVMRVKRLSKGFGVGVSPTLASKDYDGNLIPAYASDLLSGMPHATLLYLGWSVAENAPDRMQKYLVCNDERREVAWAIRLGAEGDGPPAIQLPLPEGNDDDGPRRVRVKPGAVRKVNE